MRPVIPANMILALAVAYVSSFAASDTAFQTPAMGWNSYDCYGTMVREQEVKDNAAYMANKLKALGWKYIVIDACWSKPDNSLGTPAWQSQHPSWIANMDQYGRLIPDALRFPSSNGQSFKPLADSVHAKGLKFGIHLMRGIPRQAVSDNTLILGTTYHAADIADKSSTCPWSTDMWGIDMTKAGAQAYLNSCLIMYASWGVDFIKVDDLIRIQRTSGNEYHGPELVGYRKAIDSCGRVIFLSTSPGPASYPNRDELAANANSWRITDDLWDQWNNDTTLSLKQHFTEWEKWFPYIGPGHWPDNDMLPLGRLSKRGPGYGAANRYTLFTRDEQYTLVTMTAITRSPMMFGGNLPENNAFTDSLITNAAVISVNQHSENNRVVYSGNYPVWCANIPGSNDKYCALFNKTDAAGTVSVRLHDLCLISSQATVQNLWTGQNMGQITDSFSTPINVHGAGLYRVTPVGSTPVTDPTKMTGTPFGIGPVFTVGSEHTKALDGDVATFYDYNSPNEGFTGIDFGPDSIRKIATIRYYPRNGWESRMNGGKFQGSNSSMFSGYVDLYTIPGTPASGSWTSVTLNLTKAYRHVRYLGPDGSYSNIGEMEFHSNDLTNVQTPLAKAPLRRALRSIFRVAGRQFVVPQEFSGSTKSITVYNLSGKCIKQSLIKKEIVDVQKDLGLPEGVYIMRR